MYLCIHAVIQRCDEVEEQLPGGDGSGVVVPALAIPTPVVTHQVHVQVVCGYLGLAPLQLLHRPFTHEERGCACT